MDKTDKVNFDMIYSLSIHIARFHSQSRTWGGGGGAAYLQDKNTCAETLPKDGRGAYNIMREGAYSRDTTVCVC